MSEKGKKVWLLIDAGGGIGGAESRIIKMASRIAEHENVKQINIVVPKILFSIYKTHEQLKEQMNHPKINFIIVPGGIRKIWSVLYNRLYKLGLLNTHLQKKLLKKKSWYTFLQNKVQQEDILHCYRGENARVATLLINCELGKKAILEITSNRRLELFSEQFKLFLSDKRSCSELMVRCVSKNVWRNFTEHLTENWFEEKGIDLGYYSGPFIDFKKEIKSVARTNTILFPHRFTAPKNGVLFSKVIDELLTEGYLLDWRILFRGKGTQEELIKENLKKWIEFGNVEVGFSNNLFEEFLRAKIAVSLIKTGNYPSQSLFEAMQAGCALLVSDTGNTKEEFNHPSVTFTKLDKDQIKQNLIELTNINVQDFEKISVDMKNYFEWFIENRNQFQDIKKMYTLD